MANTEIQIILNVAEVRRGESFGDVKTIRSKKYAKAVSLEDLFLKDHSSKEYIKNMLKGVGDNIGDTLAKWWEERYPNWEV